MVRGFVFSCLSLSLSLSFFLADITKNERGLIWFWQRQRHTCTADSTFKSFREFTPTPESSRWLKFWTLTGLLHGISGGASMLHVGVVACMLLPNGRGAEFTEYAFDRLLAPAIAFLDKRVLSKAGHINGTIASSISAVIRWIVDASLEPALLGMDDADLIVFRREVENCLHAVQAEQRKRRTAAFRRVKTDQDRVLSRRFGTGVASSDRRRPRRDPLLDDIIDDASERVMDEYDEDEDDSIYGTLRRRWRGRNANMSEPRKKSDRPLACTALAERPRDMISLA